MSPKPRIIVATRNRHKLAEIQAMLGESWVCEGLDAFSKLPPIDEDAPTFEGNAAKKALGVWQYLEEVAADHPDFVLADDSGLEVDALQGAPGVHSARFAASEGFSNAPDAANNAKLLRLLRNVENRNARFRCVLALIDVQEKPTKPLFFEGVCEGRIEREPRGSDGFGYDPLFIPDGFKQSFAELGEEAKNKISHRAGAVHRLAKWLNTRSS